MLKKITSILLIFNLLTLVAPLTQGYQPSLLSTSTTQTILVKNAWFKYNISYVWQGNSQWDNITIEITDLNSTTVTVNDTLFLVVYTAVTRHIKYSWNLSNGIVPPFYMNITRYVKYLQTENLSIVLNSEYFTVVAPQFYIHSYNNTHINLTTINYGIQKTNDTETLLTTTVNSEIFTTSEGLVLYWFSNYTLTSQSCSATSGPYSVQSTVSEKSESGKFLQSNLFSTNNTEAPELTENNTQYQTQNGTIIIPLSPIGLVVSFTATFAIIFLVIWIWEKMERRKDY